MSEVTDSFTGRPVLSKHKSFALYHPAAFCLAQITADIPVLFFQVSIFSLVLYFMVGLTMTAGAFFTFWVIVFATAMCMTALFRAVGAAFSTFDGASKVSGFLISALIMYTGYMIRKPLMHPVSFQTSDVRRHANLVNSGLYGFTVRAAQSHHFFWSPLHPTNFL
jgi:ABC-type multidrug transport system permease subunit